MPTGADAPALAITRNAGAKLHIFSEKPNKKVGKFLFIPILFLTLLQESKRFEIMNTAVRTIQDTPMAPYAGMMKSMEPSDMQAVILFLQDAMREAEETKRKADDEFLAKKLAEIKVDPDIDELVDWLRLTPEEAADERTRWILGLDRK